MGEPLSQNDELPDLAELFRLHASGLAGAARGVLGPGTDTQEILQEAFLKAWRAQRRGTTPTDPVAWIFVVTLNVAKDLRRQQGRRQPGLSLDEVSPMTMNAPEADPASRMEYDEALEAARSAIHALEDHEKEVFLMRVSGGLTFEAVADQLGIPVGTAKTRMRKALGRLRTRLGASALPCLPPNTQSGGRSAS